MPQEKRIHVLVFGLNKDLYQQWRLEVKSGLQSMDMAWQFTSCLCSSREETVTYSQQNKDLDIVYFANGLGRSRNDTRDDGYFIARALSTHINHPWVCLDSEELSYLINIFELQNVRVFNRMIEQVIQFRFSELSKEASVK